MTRPIEHDPALDGLRGIAILSVLCFHSIIPPTAASPLLDRVVAGIFGIGWAGVDLFFVLSGYLITGILLDTKGGAGYFRSFYARRMLRIFPLYYIALVVMLVVVPPLATPFISDPAQFRAGGFYLWTYIANWHVAHAGSWDVISPLTVPYWSLAVEEQFYLVWPLVVLVCSRRTLAWVAGGLIVTALIMRLTLLPSGNGLGIYVLTVTRMDTLAMGAAIAVAERSHGGLHRLARFAAPAALVSVLVLAGVVAITLSTSHYTPAMGTVGFTALAFGFGALLVFSRTAAPGALRVRWLRRLGERSYGVYIWQMLPLRGISALALAEHIPLVAGSWVLRQLFVAGAALALSWAVAEVSWYVLEAPFLRLKRFVPRPVPRSEHATPRMPALAASPEY
jgi:peptidoglycan/LPS O-acetylase OafA/YrhL